MAFYDDSTTHDVIAYSPGYSPLECYQRGKKYKESDV